MKRPTKAIIAAAGIGTRFLPQTKAMPKEMLPIIDRPVIQLVVEEAVAAGVTDVIIVTGSTKRAIEDHFDRSDEMENELRSRGKEELADTLKQIAELANFIYIRQKGAPKGNARPVLNAAHLIDADEPFYVFFADDFFRAEVPRAKQLLNVHERTGKSVISLVEVSPEDTKKYGMAAIESQDGENSFKLNGLVEKPGPENIPSQLAVVGGYLLTPDILPIIAQEKLGVGDEIVLADSINELALADEVYGCLIDGVYHDTGDQLKYLEVLVDMALSNEKLQTNFRTYLEERLQK